MIQNLVLDSNFHIVWNYIINMLKAKQDYAWLQPWSYYTHRLAVHRAHELASWLLWHISKVTCKNMCIQLGYAQLYKRRANECVDNSRFEFLPFLSSYVICLIDSLVSCEKGFIPSFYESFIYSSSYYYKLTTWGISVARTWFMIPLDNIKNLSKV